MIELSESQNANDTGVSLIAYGVSQYLGPAQKYWNDKAEERVTQTTESVKHVTSLKMMGFGRNAVDHIRDLMSRKIVASKAWRTVMLISWVASKYCEDQVSVRI